MESVGSGPYTIVADLSQLVDVEAVASEIKSRYQAIDVLINNAGVHMAPDTRTGKGWDLRSMVNTFAPYLMIYKRRQTIRHIVRW